MFERYTEAARHLIFRARNEAAQSGSPGIETEHLLLALLKEDNSLLLRLLPADAPRSSKTICAEHFPPVHRATNGCESFSRYETRVGLWS